MVQVRTLEQNHLTSMQDLAELTDDDLRKLAVSSVGLGASLCVCIPAYLSFFLKLCACWNQPPELQQMLERGYKLVSVHACAQH